MTENKKYIVQYVGFKTDLNEDKFLKRWTPFAYSFKNAGIKSIDLYEVKNNTNIQFISRNIWEESIYFKNFPSGVATGNGGGGVNVIQFGGYWIDEKELSKPPTMNILFSNEKITQKENISVKNRCTENVKNIYLIEFFGPENDDISNAILICNHLKTI